MRNLWYRIVNHWLCIKYGWGQSWTNVQCATDYSNDCRKWETYMMKAIGEDGVGSVAAAIENLKRENETMRQELLIYETFIPGIIMELNELKAREVEP